MKPNIGRDGNIGDHQPSHRRSIWRALVRSPRRTLFVAVAMTLIATIAAPAGAGSVASIGETTDAVTVWNANAGEAAIAACISPDDNPLHESRMYAMTHVAIHDAVNAIDRRSAPYVFIGTRGAPRVAGRRRGGRRARRAGPAHRSAPASPSRRLQRRRRRERGGGLRGRARRDPGRPARRTQGVEVGQAAAAAILASERTTARTRRCWTSTTRRAPSPASTASRPVPRSRSHRGGGTSRRSCCSDSSQFRPASAVRRDQREVHRGLQRGEALGGDGVTTPSDRTADQTEIALFWVESSPLQWNRIATDRLGRPRPRPVGERPPVRAAQHGHGRRLHRLVRDEVPLQLLAAGHRDPDWPTPTATRTPTPTRPGRRW